MYNHKTETQNSAVTSELTGNRLRKLGVIKKTIKNPQKKTTYYNAYPKNQHGNHARTGSSKKRSPHREPVQNLKQKTQTLPK